MKVLLQKTVAGHGRAGEIIEVSDSYARNFLIPTRVAIAATAAVVRQQAAAKQRQAAATATSQQREDAIGHQLSSLVLVIRRPATSQGKLFAALKDNDIRAEILRTHGLNCTGAVLTPNHFKRVGQETIEFRWPSGVLARMQLIIEPMA